MFRSYGVNSTLSFHLNSALHTLLFLIPFSLPTEVTDTTTNNNDRDTSNQVKLVKVYNKVADNVLNILSHSLSAVDPLPLSIQDDV